LREIRNILKDYSGNTPVIFYEEESKKAFGTENNLWIDEKLFEELRDELILFTENDKEKIILK